MYTVEDLNHQYGAELELTLVAGSRGLTRRIRIPEAQRPGLALAGYLKNYAHKRILVFGRVELSYLKDLSKEVQKSRLEALLTPDTPAVIIARRHKPPSGLQKICEEKGVPLFRSKKTTMTVLSKLAIVLNEEFAQSLTCHGTLVEVFGVGVFLRGDSSIGKSETALGLLERGHRLISDDVVRVKKKEGSYLEGHGAEVTQHHMEIRGVGIINVAHLYGAVCVRPSKSIEMIAELVEWDDNVYYDRVGADERYSELLGIKLPHYTVPVKPGRDVVLLIETLALNHRLKQMGYNSAREFNRNLLSVLTKKQRKRRRVRDELQTS